MLDQNSLSEQEILVRSIAHILEQDAPPVQVFETHISWIVVSENDAYKFKKAVHFDFLDFSTLNARHFYCQEELRLNRRLAPDIYLEVVSITGTPLRPVIDGAGTPIEYAVKMRAFPQQALWRYRIEHGGISAREIDELAQKLAQFHQDVAIAPQDSLWSTPEANQSIADGNLILIASLVKTAEEKRVVNHLRTWQNAQQHKLRSVFEKRRAQGFVRECHGDLHSGNLLTLNDHVAVFDCIEFNESLRWIDVMNDLAFAYMDLRFHGHHAMAARLLNGYLAITGDYDGLTVLRYYQTQRALVRCKVALLRAGQLAKEGQVENASFAKEAAKYIAFSLQSIKPMSSAIILTHGYSGSGKSTFSRCLLELIGAVQIRSDVERKRLLGISARSEAVAAARAPLGAGLYNQAATQATYERLRRLAQTVVESAMPVIVDATFLQKSQRRLFENLAASLGVPFFIMDIHADPATLQARIAERARVGCDASDAGLEVLAHQLAHHDALTDDEKMYVLSIDCAAVRDMDAIRTACEPIMTALRNAAAGL